MKKCWLCLAASVLALGIGGCAPAEGEIAPTPTGGYVETAVKIPEGYMRAFFPHPDGSLDFFGKKEAGIGAVHSKYLLTHFFSPDGGTTWEEREADGWMREIARVCQVGMLGEETPDMELLNPLAMDMDDGHNIYAAVMDNHGVYRLLTVSPEGEVGEIPVPELASDLRDYRPGGIVSLQVDGKRAGIAFRRSPIILSPGPPHQKSVLRRLGQDEIRQAAFTKANILVSTGRELIVLSSENGKELRRFQPPMSAQRNTHVFGPMAAGSDGAVYFASCYGIDRLPENGTVFEMMLTDERYRFVGENVEVDDIWYIAESDTFYVRFVRFAADGTGRWEICRYIYDPEYAPEG